MSPIEMYDTSLEWAQNVITQTADLDRIMRSADAFISANTEIFAEHGD